MKHFTLLFALFLCTILRGQPTKINAVSLLKNGGNGSVLATNASGNVEWQTYANLKNNLGIGGFNGSYSSLTGTPSLTLQNITANGNTTSYSIVMDGYGDRGLYGTYDPTRPSTVFGMGTGYTLGVTPQSYGNFYGIARSYEPNYGATGNNAQGKSGLGHQFLVMENGVTTSAIGNGMWTNGISTANGFITNGSYVTNGSSFVINDPINTNGISYQTSGLNRFFHRYGGDETTLNGGVLQWYSYTNSGTYNDLVMSISRGGDLFARKMLSGTNTPYSDEKLRVLGNIHLDNNYSLQTQNNAGSVKNVINLWDGNIQIGAGYANGLTNKVRFYNAGGTLESETDNSYGFGINHASGRFSMSAGQNGYIDFFTQNQKRVTINYDGSATFKENVVCDNGIYSQTMHASSYVRAYNAINKGYAQIHIGSIDYGGYFEIFRPNGIRTLYVGFPTINGSNNYVAENGSWHRFEGGKVEIASSIEVPNATTGIEALNWNTADTRYSKNGNFGQLKLHATYQDMNLVNEVGMSYVQGNLNAPTWSGGFGQHYQTLQQLGSEYPFQEYAMQTCIARLTTTPYQSIRFKEGGVWGQWMKTWAGNSDNLNNQPASFYQNATNLTIGTLNDARLSTNVPLKNATNTFTGFNSFEGGYTTRFETINIRNTAVSLTNSAGIFQNNTGVMEIKANITNPTKVFINTLNELDITGATNQTAKTIHDQINQSSTVTFTPNSTNTLPAIHRILKMVKGAGFSGSDGVSVQLVAPITNNREQLVIFSGAPLNSSSSGIIFIPPSGWTIMNASGNKSFLVPNSEDSSLGVIYRVNFISHDNTISIIRHRDN